MRRKDVNPNSRRNKATLSHSPIKITLLGSDGVGKSALAVRLLTRRFIGEYDSTLEAAYRHQVEIENDYVSIELMDTAGESFDEARRIASYVKEHKTSDSTVMMLIGTKKDLEHFREVEEGVGKKCALELDSGFCELSISASEGYKEVIDVVKYCIQQFLRNDKKERSQKSNNSSLVKMKEGLIRRTGSLRRKSVAF